jgi:hypothetical protein
MKMHFFLFFIFCQKSFWERMKKRVDFHRFLNPPFSSDEVYGVLQERESEAK